MNLIDENVEIEQNQNKKKMIKIILISIGILLLLVAILLIYSSIKKNNTLKLQINNTSIEPPSGLIYMNDGKKIYVDENNQIYISVKKLSAILGIEIYNDEYKNSGEDTTKCYIKTSTEYTSYISNSSQIYKAVIVENSQSNKNNETSQPTIEYEYFQTNGDVKYINGEIYACEDAIELGFNIDIQYNQSTKTIVIYTLDALESYASNIVSNAVVGNDVSYSNKKLLKYGMILIQNGAGEYGISDYYNYSEGDYILSCKYSKIRFIESSKMLIVTEAETGNQGVLQVDLQERKAFKKIDPIYQSITRMDSDLNLYLVKANNRYGVIRINNSDSSEDDDIILKVEYQQIGLDADLYPEMDNKYIIADKYIPIKIDNSWGLASLDGKILINPQYEGIGCNIAETGDPVIILSELLNGDDGIVFVKNAEEGIYIIINVNTGKQIGYEAIEIYSKYEKLARNYYMKYYLNENEGGLMRDINIYSAFGKKLNNNNANSDASNANATNNITTNTTNNINSTN